VTIKLSNTGNTAIRSMYVSAASTDSLEVSGTSEKFIGTLSVDDFASFQVTVNQKRQGSSGNQNSIPITIVFKDNDNVEHTVRGNVPIASSSVLAATSATSGTTPASGAYPGRMGGGAQTQNIPLYAGIGVVILGGMYLAYRKLKGKPKNPGAVNEAKR
jgi:hypothetical protein